MKKIVASLLLIVGFAFCFAGCQETDNEYWKTTGMEISTFFESDEYTSSINSTFSQNLENLMTKEYAGEYVELKTIYAKLYEQTIFCSAKYVNVFERTTPTNNNKQLKNAFNTIISKFNDYKMEVVKFNTARNNYESYISFADKQDVALSDIEISRLNNFKLNYLSLLDKTYELSKEIFRAYELGYNSFVNTDEITAEELKPLIEINLKLALNGTNLQLAHSTIKTLKVYLNKEVSNDYNTLWTNSIAFFNDTVKFVYENDMSGLNENNMLNKFKVWKGVYDAFLEDTKTFNEIVDGLQIDVLKKYDNDAKKYAEVTKNPLNESNANFFLNYHKNVKALYDYAVGLIAG